MAVLMILSLLVCLGAFPQDNETAAVDSTVDDYFLSRLNPAIGPAPAPRSNIWEDEIYNQAVALYKQGIRASRIDVRESL